MRRWLKDFDFTVFGTMALLITIGIFTIYAAAYELDAGEARPYWLRQLSRALIGMLIMIPVIAIDYRTIARLVWPLYGLGILLLLAVPLAGTFGGGAQRWLELGVLRLQPSEPMKLGILFALAIFLAKREDDIQHPLTLIAALLVAGIPTVLIAGQPDLGTAIAVAPMVAVVLYVSGASRRHILALGLLGLCALPVGWLVLQDYQRARILSFIDPSADPLGSSYQLIQSRIAVGSGQWLGKGWLGGTQTQLNFLPVQHTDFIFSVYAEQWGFVGSMALMALYGLLLAQGIGIALKARDLLGSLLVMGVLTLIMWQVFFNLGMTVGLLPVSGLPLPFLSYGGSSLIVFMLGIALILNVRLRQYVF